MGEPSSSAARKVAVLGASGRTGRRVVDQAVRAGHDVTAVVRDPAAFALSHRTGLRVVTGDVRSADSLGAAIGGADVVVSALGPRGRTADGLYSAAARATVTAMGGGGRLLTVTSAGVRYDDPELALWYRVLVRPLIRELYADMIAAEELIRAGDVDWTFVRPVLLRDRDAVTTYRVGDGGVPARGRTITCAEVAHFVVGEIGEPRWSRRAPTLAR
jgi:putative NADH-flavin reductase